MLLGIISDTHGLLRPEAEAALAGVSRILHAGDVGKPEILDALAKGGKQLARVPGVTRGVRRDFISVHEFSDIRSLTYISSDNVYGRNIVRHGSKVVRVNTYKYVTNTASKYVLVYLTADNLMTDEDIVDD